MEIFDKIGEVASQTYRYTAEKADKFAKETKIRKKIYDNKEKINEIYKEIGEAEYRKYLKVDDEDFDEKIRIACEQINMFSKEISELNDELLNLKERKKCNNCHELIEKSCKYCPNCGCEQNNNEELK